MPRLSLPYIVSSSETIGRKKPAPAGEPRSEPGALGVQTPQESILRLQPWSCEVKLSAALIGPKASSREEPWLAAIVIGSVDENVGWLPALMRRGPT